MIKADEVFGCIIDIINTFIKGIVMYFLVLMFHFWGYQDGGGAFNPWLCMLIFVCGFEVLLLEKIINKKKIRNKLIIAVCILACGAINWVLSRIICAGENAFFIISMLPFIESVVNRYRFEEEKDFIQTMRNRNSNNAKKYGIIMCVIAILTIVESDYPSAEYPIAVDNCMTYSYVFFVIYLALIIVLKYIRVQYNEARKYNGSNTNFLKRQLKVDLIVFGFAIIIFVPIVFLVQKTIIVPLCMFIVRIFLGLFNMGFSFISGELLEKLLGLFNMTEKTTVAESGGQKLVMSANFDFNLFAILLIIFAVIIVVAIVLSLLKLYKVKGVYYKGEDEEYTYVTEEDLRSLEVKEIVPLKISFSRNNEGMIRKYYYKYMNSRINTSELKEALCSTPEELADNYAKHDDEKLVKQFTESYEMARYSSQNAKSGDVKKMKKMYKDLMG